jgi:integrase
VKDFARFLKRAPDTATAEDLRRYQLHLTDSGVSRVSLTAAVTALRFFFEITLGRGELMAAMSHVRVARTLPVVLSPEEITRLLAAAPGLKYEAALSGAYGAGLRASEVVGLRVDDIDTERMLIRIRRGRHSGRRRGSPPGECCAYGRHYRGLARGDLRRRRARAHRDAATTSWKGPLSVCAWTQRSNNEKVSR